MSTYWTLKGDPRCQVIGEWQWEVVEAGLSPTVGEGHDPTPNVFHCLLSFLTVPHLWIVTVFCCVEHLQGSSEQSQLKVKFSGTLWITAWAGWWALSLKMFILHDVGGRHTGSKLGQGLRKQWPQESVAIGYPTLSTGTASYSSLKSTKKVTAFLAFNLLYLNWDWYHIHNIYVQLKSRWEP